MSIVFLSFWLFCCGIVLMVFYGVLCLCWNFVFFNKWFMCDGLQAI